jgi:hypothetical protein
MILFEATTGKQGCSYERCYVWAKDLYHALLKLPSQHNFELKELLSSETDSFCTKLSTDGWEI